MKTSLREETFKSGTAQDLQILFLKNVSCLQQLGLTFNLLESTRVNRNSLVVLRVPRIPLTTGKQFSVLETGVLSVGNV